MAKPEFINNQGGNTLADALCAHLDWLAATYREPVELSIATGYFNPGGFAQIANHLGSISRLRLLLGAEPIVPPKVPRRVPGKDPRGPAFEHKLIEQALQENEQGIRDDRNILEFTRDSDSSLKLLLNLLSSGKVEVRRYERGFVHGKAFIFSSDEGVIAGSSNFTAAGLLKNLELNLGHYQPGIVTRVKEWFDRLWDEANPYDLASIYAERFEEYDPHLIYLRVLWELYKDELETERQPSGRIPLTTFQNDGIDRAQRILENYNGVIIADGVGLGKTFIGGEMMRLIQENRQRVLLISPAALRDGTWDRFQKRTQLRFENISYEQLALESYDSRPEEYEMIVIDESQAFRNPSTQRAHALRKLIQGKPPKKIVLMTATPVNNSLWDLYYLMTYFLRHDAVFADRGIRSLKERFAEAQKMNPFDLTPDTLFDILDPITVRRTRRFVQKWYPNERIPGPGGVEMAVRFPEPHVEKLDYDLESILPDGFFDEFEQALAPEDSPPLLTMARYNPSAFLLSGEVEQSEVALVGLLRSALLKRFESSAHAFANTAATLAASHERFLAALDAGFVPSPEAMEEIQEVDSDQALDELLEESGSTPISRFRSSELKASVESDLRLLQTYVQVGRSIRPEDDPKLRRLVHALKDILKRADQEDSPVSRRDRIKVLIFSYYGNTVQWIFDYLKTVLEEDRELAPYRGRLAAIIGDRSLQGDSRESTIFGFAPVSTEAPHRFADDRYDILIATDVLAEGMNLQQCRNLINYDLPWNPMRLVQRHGRIDRIGSPHDNVFVKCFFPDKRLDELLILEVRVRSKLARAAASIGVESEVIPGGATAEIVFAETRAEIEAIRSGDAELLRKGGEPEGAHSGEEYRQELRKGMEERASEIVNLPWGAGSGIAGARPGWFFCAKVGEKTFLRFVPADAGDTLVEDTLGCLRSIACEPSTQRLLTNRSIEGAYPAWQRARVHIFQEWMAATDPKNLQPKIRPLFREAADQLRKNPPEGIDQVQLEECIDSLLAPWGIRYEREFRPFVTDTGMDPSSRSRLIVAKVRELGMSPAPAPEPLPLIDEDEVKLICWMGIE